MGDEDPGRCSRKPDQIITGMVSELGGLRGDLQEGALLLGEQMARLSNMRPYWAEIENARTHDPGLDDIYSAGVNALSSAHQEIVALRARIAPDLALVGQVQCSSDLTIGITGGTASMVVQGFDFPSEPAFSLTDRYADTRERLEEFDASLCQTYDAIREVLYGTKSDPERAAMYLLRQAFDHLFTRLAPDEQVRASPFWEEKPGDSPQQVTREERIRYVAYTHIREKAKAESLACSAKHMVEVYRALNAAHKRGALNPAKCRGALKEMQAIIESWVPELDISRG